MRRFSALALFAGASSLALHAQSAAPAGAKPVTATLVAALTDNGPAPSLAALSGVSYSSSSSADVPEGADHLDLPVANGDAMQPPPRRRYGRPRYNDSSHNPDGSAKYTFVLGGGFTGPVGNTFHYLNTSYGIQVGGGRNFNKNFGVLMQFDYDRFGFNGRTLYNQSVLYDPTNEYGTIGTLDGSTHIWSFSLDPVYTINTSGAVGAYVVGGVGFFHKVANFTVPEVEEECYYYCEEYEANAVIDHYTSNAPGFDGGFGITYKPSRFAGERLFAEVRYDLLLNSQRHGITVANAASYGYPNNNTYTGNNYFQANSNRTTYTVYKFGIRF